MNRTNIDIGDCDDIKPHELKVARVLAKHGGIKFLKPSRVKGVKTPDILWLGLKWEIKSPKGKGKDLIHNTLSRAVEQSENIIIDFARLKMPEAVVLKMIKKYAVEFKSIKRLKVVMKSGEILDIKKY